ncbi:peptidoglycan editing factor PgeF [Cocleimonas sp. KMM 6892]|uniref:peptidoglycan editing factor PgeF n=1 Tax=unclassified Cocleimonas TaxID=2639732 RepID=UPI002DB5E3F3|nr:MULTISPECIES: peptidoglycan editing factor PgeF [unclassified Cocleimonas]MEB8434224.1 peptidoglycan editing factor PgeF [Cocleimonas sp. KMM 6892]MEC4717157.1 peptidoglycan editing factor PgeF [Cocleimonas sp. KMM 6895]MEC4746496.1 peptidoglycan editing factor PgeF [Cocleimonas sp. KMM 6896]
MEVKYKQSSELSAIPRVKHGFFTKSGGVSSGIYDSLNCGPASADSLDNVIENRWRAIAALGLQESQLFGLNQIHSTKVYTIDKKSSDDYHPGDGLVTREKGMALSVLGADCAPVLFADKSAGVIGAAHSGWKGSVSGIIESMVESMCAIGANRENIHACIGPTIHQKSYEVRDDFLLQLQSLSGFATDQFIKEEQDKFYFDLPSYLLEQCKRSQIQGENLGLDTYELEDEFFSFRRNTHQGLKEYGRQISLICLT